MFGMNVVGQNGRFLTAKYIEVAPYSWLEKLEKIGKKITLEIERVFKAIYKKNAEKSALYSSWWAKRDLNPHDLAANRF